MDSIVLLNPSDIISESMDKINYNFSALASHEDVTNYKLSQLSKYFQDEIDKLKTNVGDSQIYILKNIDKLGDKITALPTLDNLQNAIDAAVSNSSSNLEDFIRQTAGQQISQALVGYARESSIDMSGYISTQAFNQFKADVARKTASVTSIAGNSRFLKDANGNFVWGRTENGHTAGESVIINGVGVKTIEYYYSTLSGSDLERVNGNSEYSNKLDDPDVLSRLISLCEERFRTVATELSTITQEVGEGFARTTLMSWIENPNSEGNIAAAIFAEANKDGSRISLSADHIDLTGQKVKIDTDNLKVNVNGDGKVKVKGEIEATSLVISGMDASEYIRQFIPEDGGSGGGSGGSGDDDGDDSAWLTNAFSKVEIAGGLILVGNILARDSNRKVRSGMMGGDDESSDNDIRFFAGTSSYVSTSSFMNDVRNAPFRVLEDGTLYATKANITGNITATSLTINSGSSAATTLKNFIEGVGEEKGWSSGSGDSGGDGGDDSEWLTRAFSKTEVDGGLLLAGNLLVGNSAGSVTAGMLGASTSYNDLRLFVGSDFNGRNSAPFRVMEDGSLYATNAVISGDSMFNGTLGMSFVGLSEGTTIEGTYNDNGGVAYLRYLKQNTTSLEIVHTDRYSGSAYSSSYKYQFIHLPTNVPDGTIINIIATGYNYKNIMRPVYISAKRLYYDVSGSYSFGNDLNYVSYDNSPHSTYLAYQSTFFLRLLHLRGGEYYVIQNLGTYSIVEATPQSGTSYAYGTYGGGIGSWFPD